ncbi:MAG: GNAT family N-acetyltransferase [Spirochaeta sp.]|nr:GNAT family N-acetyltransferase [Spirochaeta sp.]
MVAYNRVYRGKKIEVIRKLFQEYGDSLGFDLCFQNFKEELESLPGEYSPPEGSLVLASSGGAAAGCVALRRIDNSTCEMKRLYVRPAFRGGGIGRELCRRIITIGLELGFGSMRLDTLDSMSAALELYRSLGFREIEPYRYNPIEGALFLELRLE